MAELLISIRCEKVTLTAAQVKALFTTPLDLIAAPGSGTIIIAERITFIAAFVSVAYAGANALEFRYTNASGAKVTADIPSATLNFASGTKYSTVHGVTTELISVVNSPIVACVPVANPTLGDSPVTFVIEYRKLKLP